MKNVRKLINGFKTEFTDELDAEFGIKLSDIGFKLFYNADEGDNDSDYNWGPQKFESIPLPPIKRVMCYQTYVDRIRLFEMIDNPCEEPIQIVRYPQGHWFLSDGHHRLALAYLMKQKSIYAKFRVATHIRLKPTILVLCGLLCSGIREIQVCTINEILVVHG